MKKGKNRNIGLLPKSVRIISSCLKTVSTNATAVASTVRSAGASIAASIGSASDVHKDQVIWAGFDKLELRPSTSKNVLLLGYDNGFQVLDVEDASNFSELVSKRDGPVTFMQMQPYPAKCGGCEGFSESHPLLLIVAGDETNSLNRDQNSSGMVRNGIESNSRNHVKSPTAVRFYSLRSQSYVHILRFHSAVCMVRCSAQIVAISLASQIYCLDALTLENKFSVLTYTVPQLGPDGVNVGYGPMGVGPRWLAYASNNPLVSNTGWLSPQNISPSPGVSPSTSPGSSSFVARYAMESSKQLAAGILNLGDVGYKTLFKYCHELLPDGSNSPVSSSSGSKVCRHSGTDTDNAGVVVVKDFVSRAVISQFKAHVGPISALCFDPSGTLLVTASVHGNNINLYRIMPSRTRSKTGSCSYDWTSSSVHLYNLHRGITSAIIQDICFSQSSQWIAIVTSKGTCHVFTLSPFGGDISFQTKITHGEELSSFPVLPLPWWSSSSIINERSIPPPPQPATLSVVSRIKYNDSGWLNSNAAPSTTGKIFVPSGAVAAVFHNSISHFQHSNLTTNSLEHILVYTPSGHVIQHKLLPSVKVESSDISPRIRPGSFLQLQEEEFLVKVEPVQWWDVSRRSHCPEIEECMLGVTCGRQEVSKMTLDKSACKNSYRMNFLDINDCVGERKLVKKPDILESLEKTHRYLSNAEVQINCGRFPILQKSKIGFSMISSQSAKVDVNGEFEIEKLPVHVIEIKRKELMPIFNLFHGIKSYWIDRTYPMCSPFEPPSRDKVTEETIICHSKPASLSSTESSDGGSSRRMENLPDFDQMSHEKPCSPACQTVTDLSPKQKGDIIVNVSLENQKALENVLSTSGNINIADSPVHRSSVAGVLCLLESYSPADSGLADEAPTIDSGVENHVSESDTFVSYINAFAEGPAISGGYKQFDIEQFIQEGHCKAPELDEHRRSSEVLSNDLNNIGILYDKEKPEDDGENDKIVGGIFMFNEEEG